MRDTFRQALASGTIKNRKNQAAIYIKFMLIYGLDFLNPSITDVAMNSQFLANSYISPASTKNHLSGIKAWLNLHGGDSQAFILQELCLMCKAISEKSQHVPSLVAPLSPSDILKICTFSNNNHPISPAIKAAILLAYATLLRVSNVLSPSKQEFGGPHTLRAQDICITASGLKVIIHSTKTRKGKRPHTQCFPGTSTTCMSSQRLDRV